MTCRTVAAAAATLATVSLSCCSTPDTPAPAATEATEVSALVPRVVYSHEGGLTTINALTGETIAEEKHPGFFRLGRSSDPHLLLVIDGDGFREFNTGNEVRAHGDHSHYYESAPGFTGVIYPAAEAGHVVAHDGRTALFADGTGEVTVLDDQPRTFATGEAHHGVAVPLADGTLLHTVGNKEKRSTVRHSTMDGEVLAETTACPNVHGEAVAQGGAVVFGCTDGPVVFSGEKFHKIAARGYQRSGNLAGSAVSPVVLGDLKVDEHAVQEHPTSVALIDTRDNSLREVGLDSTYWFRSLGRGPDGEALVLTTDGDLTVIDPESGEILREISAIAPWAEHTEWQQPGPILQVSGTDAYITDAENNELVIIDLQKGEVTLRHPLEHSPIEMAVS